MNLARRTEILTAPGTSRMRTAANELKEQGKRVINFAAGELDLDTSEIVKTGAIEAIRDGRNSYTPTMGIKTLRKQVSSLVARHTGINYSVEEVGLTSGAKQALFNAMMVLLDPGDEVLIPAPYWVTFPTQVELAGAHPVFIDTRASGYQLTADAVVAAITEKTKAIIINTPNNPTGVVYQETHLQRIAQLAMEHEFWVISDDCYSQLLRNDLSSGHILSLEPQLKNQLVLVNSFSKSMALTGWRLGYVAAPANLITAMERLQGHSTSNPNCISQYAVSLALEKSDDTFLTNANKILDERLAHALEIISEIPDVHVASPQGAFYLFMDVSAHFGKTVDNNVVRDANDFCLSALETAQIAMVSGIAFGEAACVRISYAVSTDEVIEGMQRLRDFIKRMV